MSCASWSDGLYLAFSRNTIVSRRTPTFLARSSCVILSLALSSRIRLFIEFPDKVKIEPETGIKYCHTKNTEPHKGMAFIINSVADVH